MGLRTIATVTKREKTRQMRVQKVSKDQSQIFRPSLITSQFNKTNVLEAFLSWRGEIHKSWWLPDPSICWSGILCPDQNFARSWTVAKSTLGKIPPLKVPSMDSLPCALFVWKRWQASGNRPRVSKQWFPNGGSTLLGQSDSLTPFSAPI